MSNSNIKAIFFDFGGTLIDSLQLWEEIDEKFLGSLNIPVPDRLKDEIEGLSFQQTAVYFKDKFNLSMTEEEIVETWFHLAKEAYKNDVKLLPGAVEILNEIKRKKIDLILLTSNRSALVDSTLERLGISSFFLERHYDSHKEKEETYISLIKNRNIEPENYILIDDALTSLKAAKNVGIRSAWILIGKTDKNFYITQKNSFIDTVVSDSLTELIEMI